jgi:integrase
MVRQDRAYTTEEILRLLEFCDERQRAIVLLMASTGVRLGSLPLLHLRHLSLMTDYDLYQVTICANTTDEYYTFTTPEAKRSIDAYLQFRERCGEKLTKDSPLFRQQFDRNDSLDVTHLMLCQFLDFSVIIYFINYLVFEQIQKMRFWQHTCN